MSELTLACVQAEPVVLDATASMAKTVDLVRVNDDADVIAFPETFVPGYAHWAHDASFESDAHKRLHARLVNEALTLPDDLGPIQDAASAADATVVLPVTETDPDTPGTPYNTIAVIGPDGSYRGKHRKLVPTHHERTVYGYGDGDTMQAFEHRGTRLGGLLCWENYMPLARAALYQQGIQLYVAPTADDRDDWQTAMRFVAHEARCFVIAPALYQTKDAFPEDFELADTQAWHEEPHVNEAGGSAIFAPDGTVIEGPTYEKETTLTATVTVEDTIAERQTFDPAGHFARDEVLDLTLHGLEEDHS